jgi:hypothetical protein
VVNSRTQRVFGHDAIVIWDVAAKCNSRDMFQIEISMSKCPYSQPSLLETCLSLDTSLNSLS